MSTTVEVSMRAMVTDNPRMITEGMESQTAEETTRFTTDVATDAVTDVEADVWTDVFSEMLTTETTLVAGNMLFKIVMNQFQSSDRMNYCSFMSRFEVSMHDIKNSVTNYDQRYASLMFILF